MSERYRVELAKRASKDLTRLRNLEETITRGLLSLEEDPYKGHLLTGRILTPRVYGIRPRPSISHAARRPGGDDG